MNQFKALKFLVFSLLLFGVAVTYSGCMSAGEVQGVQKQNDDLSVAAAQASVTRETLDAIITTSERFTERFGTFTNQDNYQNFENLKAYATRDMQTWLATFASQQKSDLAASNTVFYGVTTKALTAKILNARPDTIQILINTKREEVTDQSDSATTSYQNMLLEMRKVDDDWKVQSAQFQKS